uniref:Nif11 domain-containing protein n=1 Tax=uncultured bacterium fosmid pJB77G10 TaxID=1478069 RepID=A0A0H3UAK3_9BACT|nr:hypothetical protein [uncultured bacterium fosmid pJB77G10]
MDNIKELFDKAKDCETAEELVALAKENGYELDLEDAEAYYQEISEGELADEELDNVAGGQDGCVGDRKAYRYKTWSRKEDVEFLFQPGDHVEAYPPFLGEHTAGCKVVSMYANGIRQNEWRDEYWLEKDPGCSTLFAKGYYTRDRIQVQGK